MFKPLCVSCLIFVTGIFAVPVFADDDQPANTEMSSPGSNSSDINNNLNNSSNSNNASDTISNTARQPLQGRIQKIELDERTFQDVALDLKTALRGASSLYDEVTRQPVRVVTQPEMIASGTIVNVPIGTEPTGPPQPARKAYLDAAMRKMRPIIDNFKNNVDEFLSGEKQLDVSPTVMTRLQPQIQAWVKSVNAIAIEQRQLEQITYAPPYDNESIARMATILSEHLKNLERVRSEVYKLMRKEGKRKSA